MAEVAFNKELLTSTYVNVRRVRLLLDYFDDVLGTRAAVKFLRRVELHNIPKHATWLKTVEVEVGILSRQCVSRRIDYRQIFEPEIAVCQQIRDEEKRTIASNFTQQDADRKPAHHHVLNL